MPKKPSVPLRSLVRGLVRSSWHKQNFYNIFKKATPFTLSLKDFAKRWRSKKETRAYHGDHLTERQWQGIFSPTLSAVSHIKEHNSTEALSDEREEVPLAMQLYAPLERRLDTALFRAMFASSPKQARQYITTGKVRVNGEKMKHAFYPLRPGDVFSVDPECVMRALGRQKPTTAKSEEIDAKQIELFEQFLARCRENPEEMFREKFQPISVDGKYHPERLHRQVRQMAAARVQEQIAGIDSEEFDKTEYIEEAQTELDMLRTKYEEDPEARLSEDKSLDESIKQALALKVKAGDSKHKDLIAKMVQSKLDGKKDELRELYRSFSGPSTVYSPTWYYAYLEEYCGSKLPWQQGAYGLQEPDKSYFTPWTPRTFLAPFAILPAHIEISFKTCTAVYMRDPVIRRGHSEILSPLPLELHEGAYKFYVRRRK
ncbi:mitochondrial 37S ribosomal protein uS4m [Limtongia smithiae]|uniref:mitochondrial 37S ribosomal protein uS4m n=1 Tax=Limtongia smithiae TaxID=1125753 RepID=UPI0034CEA7A7